MITNDAIKKSRLSAALSLLDESGLVNGKDEISPALVKNILNIRYGLEGELRRLPTEKDDSFILTCDGGHRLVKISSSGESRGVVEMQSAVMEWLNNHTSAWEVQNVITTLDGESIVPIQTKSVRYLRVLTYISGDIMATVPVDEEQLILTGRAAGEIDMALRGFAHQHDLHPLVWDLANVPTLEILQEELTDENLRALAAEAFERFTRNVVPLMGELETQVIHGDFSPYNVLVSAESADFVSGIIDFGDAVRTCVIFEPAVSVCNLLGKWADDPWGLPWLICGDICRAIKCHQRMRYSLLMRLLLVWHYVRWFLNGEHNVSLTAGNILNLMQNMTGTTSQWRWRRPFQMCRRASITYLQRHLSDRSNDQ